MPGGDLQRARNETAASLEAIGLNPCALSSKPPAFMHSSGSRGTSEITESILVDTTGAPSLLAVTVRATGSSADILRQQIERMGQEKFEQERLQYFANRYVTAKRIRKVLYRDRPKVNEFTIIEVFEINGFLKKPKAGMCTFQLPGNAILDTLRTVPKAEEQQKQLLLPHPSHLIHTFEVQSSSLQPMAAPRIGLESRCLRFNRRQKSLHKYWSMTFEFSTLASSIPPGQLGEHEELVARLSQESTWSLTLPAGVSHLRPPHEFGQLPGEPLRDRPKPAVDAQRVVADGPKRAPALNETAPSSRVDRRRIRSMRTEHIIVLVILFFFILIIGYLLFFLAGVRQPGM
jgi:hypothetical protein